jgi:hypothetical protein
MLGEQVAANGTSSVITMPGAGSPSCSALRKRVDSALNSHATPAPVASPPAATITNVIDASRSENMPVSAAAIANFSATRPDASFISASPSRMCISCGGMRPCRRCRTAHRIGRRQHGRERERDRQRQLGYQPVREIPDGEYAS